MTEHIVGTKNTRLVLLLRGDNARHSRRLLDPLLKRAAEELGQDYVRWAFLEGGQPSLMEVACEVAEKGARAMFVLPLFMSMYSREEQEIPRQIVEVKACFPALDVRLQAPVGEHPLMLEAILAIARATPQ